jgi:DNA-binding GntR family transcriptional regulator
MASPGHPAQARPPEVSPRARAVVTVQQATLLWLREQIATGAVRAGAQLRQEQLAQQFGVSVPPVREALKTLEAEGQVLHVPHRGYFVASLSLDELVENYRIRELLEAEAVRRAVPRLGGPELARMREAVRLMDVAHRAADLGALSRANRAFHFTLFEAAGMPRMAEIIRVLWDATDRYRSLYFATHQHRSAVNAEHRAVLAALRTGDGQAAVEVLHRHRESALTALRDVLSDPPPTEPDAPDR